MTSVADVVFVRSDRLVHLVGFDDLVKGIFFVGQGITKEMDLKHKEDFL